MKSWPPHQREAEGNMSILVWALSGKKSIFPENLGITGSFPLLVGIQMYTAYMIWKTRIQEVYLKLGQINSTLGN